MSQSAITVTIKLFAAYLEAYGLSELVLEFPHGRPVKAVCDPFILIFVKSDRSLKDTDEVVLIQLVSGG